MTDKYEAYDLKLIELIKNGCCEYGSLSRRLQAENEAIKPGFDSARVTDRRLQALRKRGLIFFHGGKWYAKNKAFHG